jgi:hypothetical protein
MAQAKPYDPGDLNMSLLGMPITLELNEKSILSSNVEQFIQRLTFDELVGSREYDAEYDGYPALEQTQDNLDLGEDPSHLFFSQQDAPESFIYATKSWHRVVYQNVDPMKIQPFLGWRPLDIIKKTLDNTTQLARMVIRLPLRRHFKSRAPFLNVTRLDEVVSTDTMFANCKSLFHGFTGQQVYYGLKSHCIDIYGFKSKGEFPRMTLSANMAPLVPSDVTMPRKKAVKKLLTSNDAFLLRTNSQSHTINNKTLLRAVLCIG